MPDFISAPIPILTEGITLIQDPKKQNQISRADSSISSNSHNTEESLVNTKRKGVRLYKSRWASEQNKLLADEWPIILYYQLIISCVFKDCIIYSTLYIYVYIRKGRL